MPLSEIRPFQPRLREALGDRGWTVGLSQLEYLDPAWYLDTWQLVSRWSPVGFALHLVFEFDDHFYYAAVSTDRPQHHAATDWRCQLILGRSWERCLPAFLDQLDKLRDSA